MEPIRVLVLGYGEMGHAMEYLLHDRCHLDVWEKRPKAGFQSVTLDEAAPEADLVLFCLPVNPHREIAEHLAPLLKNDCISLSIAKGLDEAGETAAQIFSDIFGAHQDYALMYGPMISEEIRAGRYAFAQLGCRNEHIYDTVYKLFDGTRLYIERTSDIDGISWSVILKNIYALVFGMADELQMGDNMRGYLAAASLRELKKIVLTKGGRENSPYYLAGLGDLIATATSEDSHHHELGRMLARGEHKNIEGEGIHTLAMVIRHNLFREADYPLFSLIHDIVRDPRDIHERINNYLRCLHK